MSHVHHLQSAFEHLTSAGQRFEVTPLSVDGRSCVGYRDAPELIRDIWFDCPAPDDDVYLVYNDERMTYGQARTRILEVANGLITDFDVRSDDTVAIAMRNYPEWVVAWWAIQMVGATVVEMNSFWNADELAFAIEDSQCSVMFVDDDRLRQLASRGEFADRSGPRLIAARNSERDLGQQLGAVRWEQITGPTTRPRVDLATDDQACMVYTSGTTARPKGVLHTHRNVTTNYMSMNFMAAVMRHAERAAERASASADRRAQEQPPVARRAAKRRRRQTVMLVAVPLFHVTGSHCVMLPISGNGGRLVLMHKWEPETALRLIEREQVSNFTGVPTMTMDLLTSPAFEKYDTSSLKLMGSGGAANPPHMVDRVGGSTEHARPSQGYGLSETSGIATQNSGIFYAEKPGSVGVAVPVCDLKVIDDDGRALRTGEAGELCIRGPQVFVGYHRRPEETADVLDEDGWFHTGDIATIDADGFVSIVDRAKDIVIRGGENIGSAEVEAAIAQHPDVHECAVFGLPSERLGEEVAVAIYPVAGATLTRDAMFDHASSRLASFKVPAHYFFFDEPLPKNGSGKILKRSLREDAISADL